MRILFSGGGTGGHFYPIIAVAEEIGTVVSEKHLLPPELFYMAPTPYDAGLLVEHNIQYQKIRAGKIRRYFSLLNFFDLFKTMWGIITSLFAVYKIYPDVVFSKGGYASFPVLVAARLLFIPVVIHESDTVPGKVSLWAGKFAEKIALSWPDAAKFFPEEKVALTGNPIRKNITMAISSGARDYLELEEDVPIILVLGGSQGASRINDAIIEALPEFVEKIQIIHQTGERNFDEVKRTSEAVLSNSKYKKRYKPFPYLDPLALRMAAGAASVIVSRAGSTIFEIASWMVPAILVPIPEPTSHDQTKNAFSFARAGGGEVIEEKNLTPHVLLSEIMRIIEHPEIGQRMKDAQKMFQKPDAARMIAEEILKIALRHEIK